MNRRGATQTELADAIAAFNALADAHKLLGWVPIEEPGSEFPAHVLEAPSGKARTLRLRLRDGRVFDLRLNPGVRIGGDAIVDARRISAGDVRMAHVITSRVAPSVGEPAF